MSLKRPATGRESHKRDSFLFFACEKDRFSISYQKERILYDRTMEKILWLF